MLGTEIQIHKYDLPYFSDNIFQYIKLASLLPQDGILKFQIFIEFRFT